MADALRMDEPFKADRRRQARRAWVVPAVVYVDDRVVQVELQDVSRELDEGGAGFLAPSALEVGREVHVKVGIGPLRTPRAARVVHCRRRPDGRYWIGVQFAVVGAVVGERREAS